MKSYQVQQVDQVIDLLRSSWHGPRADPFAFDLAVVPGAGFQRWLSQQLALSGGAAGICAGVEFATFAELEASLREPADPWLPRRLAWLIPQIAESSSDPELEVLQRHLGASRQSYSAGYRIARQLRRYASYRPELLQAWQVGADTDSEGRPLGAGRWQAHLYRALLAELGQDPVQDRAALLTRLQQGPVPELPPRMAVVAPLRLDQGRIQLLQALGSHHQVDLITWQPAAARSAASRLPAGGKLRRSEFTPPPGHPLNESLATTSDELAVLAPGVSLPATPRPGTGLLGWLQHDLAADSRPAQPRELAAGDRSVQFHRSHGPDRQVEVLREVLTQTLASDPSLEPRDLVVLTPALDDFAPLLKAAFTAVPGVPNHPAQGFRLQLADRVIAQVNPLTQLLLDLLQLPLARLEASTLLEFCAQPVVARRFGFRPDAQQRLTELVTRAGIKWGLSGSQRADYGLGGFPQNTWVAGLQRMLLGVALPESDEVSIGTVLPLDDVESSDLELIGGLTELIGRLSRLLQEFEQPASAPEWSLRCQRALQDLIELPPGEDWQLSDIWSALARLAESPASSLTRAAVSSALEQDFSGSHARGAFGNGNLLVAGLETLRGVPHRVVILLGWDADQYPRPGRPHGDDLLGAEPLIGEANSALEDRQCLLDAIHSARDTMIIIARGRSETTNEEVPLAAPLVELLEALDLTATTTDHRPVHEAVTVTHPLQPFDQRYFEQPSPLLSADRISLAAARALLREPAAPRDRFQLRPLAEPDLSSGLALDELISFFVHPAKALLRVRAGLNLAEVADPGDLIPIEPDGLGRWQIGNRVLQRLRDGADPVAAAHTEWLRGEVPPFRLGERLLDQVLADARSSARLGPNDPAASKAHDLAVPIQLPGASPVLLTGRVNTQAAEVLQVEYSRLQPKHRITAWLRLLALAAAEPGAWRARVIGRGRVAHYAAPPAAVARELLSRYLQLFQLGMSRPLPALPRLGLAWAEYRASRRDPQDRLVSGKSFERCWEFDSDVHWKSFFAYPELLTVPVGDWQIPGAESGESTLVGALAQSIWAPVLSGEVAA